MKRFRISKLLHIGTPSSPKRGQASRFVIRNGITILMEIRTENQVFQNADDILRLAKAKSVKIWSDTILLQIWKQRSHTVNEEIMIVSVLAKLDICDVELLSETKTPKA